MRRHKIKLDFITLFISTMTYAINRSLSALFLECLGRNVRCSPKPLVTAADPPKQLLDFLFPNICFEHIYKFELVSYHCQSMSYKLRPVSYHLCQGYEELYLVEKPPCKEKPLKALTSDAVEICARSHTHYTLIIVQLKLSTNVSQNLAALCFAATTPAGKCSSTSV